MYWPAQSDNFFLKLGALKWAWNMLESSLNQTWTRLEEIGPLNRRCSISLAPRSHWKKKSNFFICRTINVFNIEMNFIYGLCIYMVLSKTCYKHVYSINLLKDYDFHLMENNLHCMDSYANEATIISHLKAKRYALNDQRKYLLSFSTQGIQKWK